MLVLSRRKDEGVRFPTLGIEFKVLRIGGKSVRLGVKAPRNVPVVRSELETHHESDSETIDAVPCREARNDPSKLFACLQFALQIVDFHLQRGEIDKARLMMRRAEERLASAAAEFDIKASSKPRSALVVAEDERDRRRMIDMLSHGGYAVDAVADAEEALHYLAGHDRPDLVIFDVRSEEKTDEAMQRIRKDPRWNGIKLFTLGDHRAAELGVRLAPRQSGVYRLDRNDNDTALMNAIDQEMIGSV
ncbi:hypothetical protein JCM19992_03760 [Thermostilla marina]